MKKEILYATYLDETSGDGLAYALYLATQMSAELRIVLFERGLEAQSKFDNLMSAVAFAEAGEHETARGFLNQGGAATATATMPVTAAVKHSELYEKCKSAGVSANIHSSFLNPVSAIKRMATGSDVSMVLLSPTLSQSGSTLKRLIKSGVHRPVVTMAK